MAQPTLAPVVAPPADKDLAAKLAALEAKLAALESGKPAAPEADQPKAPEMRPGGEFVVNGVRVNAFGEPLKDEPKAPPEPPKAEGDAK